MSLGLPDFGSRGLAAHDPGFWRVVRGVGFLVFAYALVTTALEWRLASEADLAMQRARAGEAEARRSADQLRRTLQANADLLIAAASIESSPAKILSDLDELLPGGVSLTGFKVDYLPDATAKADFTVVARTPASYDRFLRALSSSPRFADIRPGSESRPGALKATVTALHRPHEVPR